ncbi:NAD-dependent epimerase/dehydratase family protein [Natronolimnohabitans innermongolicus]|uniref:NAD-dependent epimerase/dehydratase n=1 Tax=Natronolimnohabitans innermongolicus JCM 12255 TaxID=1227499 RepID=L9WHS1_9EURY|nr:NAD-dependent epimerase/dehydratase family protein [Natronolimnohabitans innermongolicus]ELY48907.1 NAD-dependent epimerase/dehydratase [Natronolimnohabitans innermongolicus JCM 12255]
MRWPVTADAGLSIRNAIARIDRADSRGIVVVDDEDQLVGIATSRRLKETLFDGDTPETPLSAVIEEDPVVVDASGSIRTVDGAATVLEDEDGDSETVVAPVLDEDGTVTDVTTVDLTNTTASTVERSASDETVLVVGGAGYLGSVLCRQLLDAGFGVRVLDPLFYGAAGVSDLTETDRFSLHRGDARSVSTVLDAIAGVDAVVHLGGIVGDPASELDPEKTLEYNLHSTQLLASLCKYHGINRFVFASTCSVYGRSPDDDRRLDEDAELNPVSLYARLKIQSERVLHDLADEQFSPTILRMATIYGESPRMRFDLVGNILPAKAYTEGVIPVFGGDQYRPNVHVADAARAYVDCLTAPIQDVGDTVFNVGSNEQNYRIDELATVVADCYPEATIEYHDDQTDERSYRVEFDKIETELGFEPERTIRDHCLDLRESFESDAYDAYTSTRYNNYETLEQAPSYERTEAVLESDSITLERRQETVASKEA